MPLSTEIWKSIVTCKRSQNRINKCDLTSKEQNEELYKLDNFLEDTVKSLDYESRIYSWSKTETGYTITRKCKELANSDCKAKWLLKVNVITGRAEIYLKSQCEHIKF